MGRVWRARDELLGRDVAVKEITPGGMSRTELGDLRERAIREARAIAQINHPNVVRIFDVVEKDGAPWIIMELVPSRSLFEVLIDDGPMTPQQAAKVGLDVLAALTAAHRVGILHRDVKPANVLLASDGRVVLTDFGLATLVGDATMTRTGIVIGSPAYLAPERAADEPADAKGDLWSLGAVLFTAVEGEPPYVRSSPMATLAALMVEPPPIPKKAGPLHPVIEALLRKNPAERADAVEAERLLRAVAEPAAPAAAAPAFRPATADSIPGPPAPAAAPHGPTAPYPAGTSPSSPGAKPPSPATPHPAPTSTSQLSTPKPSTPQPGTPQPGLTAPDPIEAAPAATPTRPEAAASRPARRGAIWAAVAAALVAGGIVAIQALSGEDQPADALVSAPVSTASQSVPPSVKPRAGSASRVAAPPVSGKPAPPSATVKPSSTSTAVPGEPVKATTTPPAVKTTAPRRAPTTTMVNNTELSFAGGKWSLFGNRGLGDHENDISCTMIDGASASYEFTGTGVDYLSELNPDEGKVDVYLDGAFQQTVNLKAGPPREVQQVVFRRSGLARGKHTIKIVNKGTTLGMIDALRIYS